MSPRRSAKIFDQYQAPVRVFFKPAVALAENGKTVGGFFTDSMTGRDLTQLATSAGPRPPNKLA